MESPRPGAPPGAIAILLLGSVAVFGGCNQTPGDLVVMRAETHSAVPARKKIEIPFDCSADMLLEISGIGASLRTRVETKSAKPLSDVHLAYLRSAPNFHFVGAQQPGSCTLDVEVVHATREAGFTARWYALPDNTPADRENHLAWQQLSLGTQFVDSEDPAEWTPRLAALQQAAEIFADLGRTTPELWARYLHAYFEYYPMYRYSESLRQAQQLLLALEQHPVPALELLAHQLAGQILIEREASNDPDQASNDYASAQFHFDTAVQLAKEQHNQFEAIWGWNNKGITSKYQDNPRKALTEYETALEMASDSQDFFMLNLLASNVAVAQESLGEIRQSIATLEQILPSFRDSATVNERGHVLNLLGGYHWKLFDFEASLATLNEALDLAHQTSSAESLGRNYALLAELYRAMGQSEKSLEHIELAIPYHETARNGRALRRAHRLSADLYRLRKDWEQVAFHRARQERYLSTGEDQAEWIYGKALDARARGKGLVAHNLFAESAELYAQTQASHMSDLARLYACVSLTALDENSSCQPQSLSDSAAAVTSHQASAISLEGRYQWALILAMDERYEAALKELESLLVEMELYRATLPGVLGAWYWDSRSEIFRTYLKLVERNSTNPETSPIDSLVAIHRLRNVANPAAGEATGQATGITGDRNGSLRELIAQRDGAQDAEQLAAAQRTLDQFLLRQSTNSSSQVNIDAHQFLQQLHSLPNDWSVLTYHLDADLAWAWVGNNDGLTRVSLGDSKSITLKLRQARNRVRAEGDDQIEALLDELGTLLIAPLAESLRPNILHQGAGVLSDFPLEAIRHQGRFMIQDYLVVNSLRLDDLQARIANLNKKQQPESLLLLGNPISGSQGTERLPSALSELELVADQFASASLTILEGAKLNLDDLLGDELRTADLIHVASHAAVDMAYPELSRIELTNGYLTPSDLAGVSLEANLIVLSACQTAGVNRFAYHTNLGFVSSLLDQGAGQVIASLWPIPDRKTLEWMGYFYSGLGSESAPTEALRKSKLEIINAGNAGVDDWSAMQLFVR